MQIVSSIAAMQRLARKWQRADTRTGFVPTMGYLHAGHLSLVKRARQAVGKNGKVVVSIYVNPTQFAPKEDLAKYPRDLKRDLKLLRELGVDVVFTPSDAEMYPGNSGTGVPPVRSQQKLTGETPVPLSYSTYVVEEKLSQSMEGASRPTHFCGVTTVVAKLFNIVLPDVAVFGQKDFQQAAIIKRMVADLNFPVKIIVAPTLRERDGLAMSSRNKFLNAEQRAQATILFHALQAAKAAVKIKSISAERLKADLKEFIIAASLARLDYVEFFDPEMLEPVTQVKSDAQMALAVFFGKTRLIDNAKL
ncbi:MAG TPA: pantoate--beta-alanine ligase [Candidatus Limnocylindrales bacterium]|nr:pantoate--beta-alanine ligase [Candidatus Limnocylindrales bacterium]